VNRDQKLTQVLVDFAHILGTDFSIQLILNHLVERIVDVMAVNGAGVMLMGDDGGLHFVASTNDVIRGIERLQNELDEGPCLEAWRTGEAVSVPDLQSDERFPQFSPRARSNGMAAVFTFPLRLNQHRLGALDLYRDVPGPLSPSDRRAGQVLADVAAAYIINAQARHQAKVELAPGGRRHEPLHDALTGLPTGALLADIVEQAVQRARSDRLVATVLVDVDNLGEVNARYGRHVGDLLLQAVPVLLRQVLRSGDVIARTSDDQFAIVYEGLAGVGQAHEVARRVAAKLTGAYPLDGHRVDVEVSLGMACSAGTGETPDAVLQAAAIAVMEAKLTDFKISPGPQGAVQLGVGPAPGR
jgi:diguanylate cyclase (GGDEF)-like protein